MRRGRLRASALAVVVMVGAPLFVTVPANAATRHPPPRPNGYFKTLRAGAALPTGAQCAARIHRSRWEPRPKNAQPNARIVAQPVRLPDNTAFNRAWQRKYKPRINGKFRGTTDAERLGSILRAGTVVQVNAAGAVHSGNYLVWSVRHRINAERHEMAFVLMRNAVGATVPGVPTG